MWQIKDKINKHAFSGGQETLELQVSLITGTEEAGTVVGILICLILIQ
jgi:hypothetical protein